MAGTSVINKIALNATAETAHPTIPNLGSNVASWGTWVTIGSINEAADDADLDSESVAVKETETPWTVHPPTAQAPVDTGVVNIYVNSVQFACYDASEALLTLDSNMSITSHVGTRTTTTTLRAVCIEVNGKRLDYYPRCKVRMVTEGGSITEPVKTTVTITPVATAAGGSECERHWYQAA